MEDTLISHESTTAAAAAQSLAELERGFSQWQAALLEGRLSDLQDCTAGQRVASARLIEMISTAEKVSRKEPADSGDAWKLADLSTHAQRVRKQALIFLATLRRVRRNLETHRQAFEGCARLYTRPRPAPPEAAV